MLLWLAKLRARASDLLNMLLLCGFSVRSFNKSNWQKSSKSDRDVTKHWMNPGGCLGESSKEHLKTSLVCFPQRKYYTLYA
jgi:hypothetical protein